MCLKAATISYVNTGFCPQLTVSRLQRVFGTGNVLTCLYSLICWPTSPWSPTNLHYERGYAAAAKSLQSSPTLCDPIDDSPPGSPVPGILQARTLEWVAISFSNAWKVKVKSLSHVWLLATPWTAAFQAPPSMGFSGQEYWSGGAIAFSVKVASSFY